MEKGFLFNYVQCISWRMFSWKGLKDFSCCAFTDWISFLAASYNVRNLRLINALALSLPPLLIPFKSIAGFCMCHPKNHIIRSLLIAEIFRESDRFR